MNHQEIKIAILYYSKSGNTKVMAEHIANGCKQVNYVQVKLMDICQCDASFLKESQCVIIGTPTYYTDMAAEMKVWAAETAAVAAINNDKCL